MITNRKRDIIPINKPLKFSLPIYYIDSHYNPYAIFRINGLMDCCEDIFHINHRTPHTTFNIKHDLHAVSYSASRPTNSTSSSAMFMPAISHRQLLWWTRVLRPAPDIKHGLHALARSPLALTSHPHPRRHLMLFAEIWLFGHSAVANYSLGIASLPSFIPL